MLLGSTDTRNPMKALILESSRLYRQLIDNLLAQQGFDNDITDEVAAARELLNQQSYDLLCLNENLKDGSGLELVRQCRSSEALQGIPILFFTSDTVLARQLKELAVNAVIPKTNLQQIHDQVLHFVEQQVAPLFRKGRILLVEDSDSIAALIGEAL